MALKGHVLRPSAMGKSGLVMSMIAALGPSFHRSLSRYTVSVQ